MTETVIKLKRFRHSLTLQSLISVNEKMGIPYLINDKTLFIPFFKNDKECVLSSRIFLHLPMMKIIKFEKVIANVQFNNCKKDLQAFKKKAIETDFDYEIKCIPISLRNIYIEAEESMDNDRR